ncbi:MAG: hypothetical protein QOJ80_773 [Mycobacterium sp.]|nr:hypothetical protein [Mycobacterium sp.]
MAAPHENSQSVPGEHGTAECAEAIPVSAVEALVRLRTILDNDELTERISTELRQAGFTRVFFTRTPQEEVPRDHRDSSAAPRPAARLTVPVFAWRKPVGQLHAAADLAAHDNDSMLLRLLAEAVGAIFERNVLTERLQTVNASAREHVREIYLLSEAFAHLEI